MTHRSTSTPFNLLTKENRREKLLFIYEKKEEEKQYRAVKNI